MNKLLVNKLKLIFVAILFMLTFSIAYMTSFAKAESTFTGVDSLSLEIDGGSVIVEGDDGVNGLNFTLSIPETELNAIRSNVGTGKTYQKMETGVIIAPNYYNDAVAIDENSLFGATPTYDWAEYVDGEYKYSGDKIRVVNINQNYWIDKGDYYTYSGAIVDILPQNETEIFSALGYIRLTDASGVESYKFTGISTASVVSTALADIKDGKLEDAQIDWVNENWIEDRLGATTEGITTYDVSELSSTTFDLNTLIPTDTLSYQIYKGFGDKNDVCFRLTDVNGDSKTIACDDTLDLTNEKNLRIWTVSIVSGDAVIWSRKVDFYSHSAEFIWNDSNTAKSIKEISNSKSGDEIITTEITSRVGVDSVSNGVNVSSYTRTSGNGSWFVWKPVHTKEYYEYYKETLLQISITISADGTNRTNPDTHVINQGFIWGEGDYLVNVKEIDTLTSTISLTNIVDNWTKIIDGVWDGVWGNRQKSGMIHAYNLTNGGVFQISDLKVSLDPSTVALEGGEVLVDLDKEDDKTKVNLFNYLPKTDAEIINSYKALGISYEIKGRYSNVEIKTDDISQVDLSNVAHTAYDIIVKSYNVIVYTGVLDIFSTSNGVVWANEITEDTVKVGRVETTSLGWTNKDITQLSNGNGYEIIDASTITDTAHPLYGKTGKFVKMTSTASAEQLTYSVVPLHTKSYYKHFLGEKDYTLKFDVYVSGTFKGMSTIGAYYGKDNRSRSYAVWRGTNPGTDKWVNYSIPFDSYLIPTSGEETFSNKYLDFDNLGTKVNASNTMFQFETVASGSVVYIGLPTIDTMPEFIHSTSTEKSVDMEAREVFDLRKILSESERNKFNYYVTKYGYDKIFFRITFSDSTTHIIWANEDGSVNLDIFDVVGTTEAGASITVYDKLLLGPFKIDGRLCDVVNFPGQTNVGVFGTKSGCNNNQAIIVTGDVNFTNRPENTSVYEIAIADSTVKVLQDTFIETSVASTYTEGNTSSIYLDNTKVSDKAFNINAFQNEVEAAQLQIVSKTDVGLYKIILKDLTCGDNVLSKENFAVYHLLYTNVLRVSADEVNPTGKGLYPDAILPMDVAVANDVASLKAGVNQGVWISLTVPMDQPAGVYTGTFIVRLGISEYEIPVSITIYDYAVSEETQMKVAIGLSYTNIANLELPYEYDEDGNLIVNSSGNKTGTLSQEVVDAYVKYWTDHRLSTSPVVPQSTHFSGSWQGYPYDPDALFSFKTVTVNNRRYYAYEWPLRNKDANGNTVISNHVDNRTGYETHGYPLYLDRVDAYFNGMVELAQNKGVTTYTIPVGQASSTNFNNDNITALFNNWRGSLFEIRDDMPDGEKAHVINRLELRDVMEMFFKKAMDLHKSGTSVDVFKKARLYPTWIDEFGINASKTNNAKYLLSGMKTFFPDLADWLAAVYKTEIGDDEFILSMLDSIRNIKIGVTTNTLEEVNAEDHYANVIAVIGQYNTEEGRAEIDEWMKVAYGGEAERWVYTAGNSFPQSSNNIENTIVASRMLGWMMSEYDIEGWLYWASMNSKYMDGIVASTIKPVVGETVKDGDIIKLDDFYNNAIHYGGVPGDGFLIYPGAYYNVTGPVGTIRLETLTDSIEDYNLFSDLKAMYKDAGVEDSFYTAMRRLCEMLYSGVNCKVPAGYTNDFKISRDTLANMIVLARDSKIFFDDVYKENDEWVFSVIAPSDLAESLKSQIDATFVSSSEVAMTSGSGLKLVFKVSLDMAESGYVTVNYGDSQMNFSVETLIGTEEVEKLKWAEVNENSTYTVHNTYYSNGANNTGANVELVTLTEENAVGDRMEGNYFYVSPLKNTDTSNLGFSVLPTDIDKETVGEYIGRAKLVFDVYMITTNIADGSIRITDKVFYKLGKASNSQTGSHEWFSVSIDFKQIYDNWETLMNTEPATYKGGTNDNWSTSWRALFAVNGASHSASGVHTTSYYIGNFRIKHV